MMQCKNGFNEDAIKVQRLKLEASENPLYKFSQIVFDEIHIKESIELDRKNQEVIGPCKSLQTVMIRGLACDQKQPVYHAFDKAMTKSLLYSIIRRMEGEGFRIQGISFDLGNKTLMSQTGLDYTRNHYFNIKAYLSKCS